MSLNVHIIPHPHDRERVNKTRKRVKHEDICNAANCPASRPKHPIPIDFHG